MNGPYKPPGQRNETDHIRLSLAIAFGVFMGMLCANLLLLLIMRAYILQRLTG